MDRDPSEEKELQTTPTGFAAAAADPNSQKIRRFGTPSFLFEKPFGSSPSRDPSFAQWPFWTRPARPVQGREGWKADRRSLLFLIPTCHREGLNAAEERSLSLNKLFVQTQVFPFFPPAGKTFVGRCCFFTLLPLLRFWCCCCRRPRKLATSSFGMPMME